MTRQSTLKSACRLLLVAATVLAVLPGLASAQTVRQDRPPGPGTDTSRILDLARRENRLPVASDRPPNLLHAARGTPSGRTARTVSRAEARQATRNCSKGRRALIGGIIGGVVMGVLVADVERDFGGGSKAIVPYTALGAGVGALVGLVTCR